MRTLLFTAALFASGCLKSAAFNCADSTQCGTGGVCEQPDGLCSVASSSCASGREFDSSAGSKAGTCVGGDTPIDGPGSDTPTDTPTDTPIDAPQGCDAGFNTITNGQTNHKYKLITTTGKWDDQHNLVCVIAHSYLAIPDSATELAAIFAIDAGANGDLWIGVTDGPGNGNEGTFKDVLGNAYDAAAKVGSAVAGNSQTKDCVMTTNGTTLTAESCNQTLIAVCECEQ